jgi:hypothetical protein
LAVNVILNPVHDFMAMCHGIDVRKKRQYYSCHGRTVVSVWNEGGKRGDADVPWTVFHDGNDRTESVAELPSPLPERSDIRIGTLNTSELRS